MTMKPTYKELEKRVHELERTEFEHKRAEELLREREEHFRLLYEQAPLGYQSLDADGCLIDVNQGWLDLMGYSRDQVIGHWFGDFLEPNEVDAFKERFPRFIKTGRVYVDLQLVHHAGHTIIVHIDGRIAHDERGQFKHTRCILYDITEHKRAEELLREYDKQYRTIGETVPYGVWLTDAIGYCTYVSKSFLELVDMTMEQVQEFGWLHLLPPEDVEPTKEHWLHCVETGEHFEREHRFRAKDGNYRNILAIGRPIKDDTGKIVKWVGLSLDITERKRAEEALIETTQMLEAVIQASPLPIFAVDRERIVKTWNPAAERTFGWGAQEVIGRQYPAIPKEKRDETEALFLHALESGLTEVETLRQRKDGSLIDVSISAAPLRDSRGNINGIMAVITDITERKRAEEALRESEKRYRDLFENSTDFVYTLDLKGNFTDVNKAAEGLTGYTKNELIGMNYKDYTPEDTHEGIFKVFNGVFNQGKPLKDFPLEVIIKDGTKRYFETCVRPLRKGEEIIGFQGSSSDITERKRAEEALRQAEDNFRRSMDESPLGVRIVTMEGETIYANRAILEIYGYDSIEELRTTPVKKRYTPESYAEFRIRKKKRQRGGYTPLEYEISIVKKKGEVRHLQVFRKEILWNGERQFQVIYRDITKRKRAEEALKESESRFRNIIESSKDGIIFFDGKGQKILFGNRAMAKLLGCSKEDLAGRSIQSLHPSEEWANIKQEFLKHINDETSVSTGIPVLRNDGTVFYADISSSPIAVDGTSYSSAFFRDITERKQAAEALRESEEQYRTLVEAAPDVVYTISGEDGSITSLNPAFERLTGWSRDKWLGKPFIEIVHPDDRSFAIETFEKSCRGKTQLPYELRILSKSGEYLIGEFVSTPRIKYGNVVGELGIARDITGRKRAETALRESEARFSTIFHSSPVSIGISRVKDGQLLDVNDAWQKLIGFSREEAIGRNTIKLNAWVNPGDRDRLISRLSEDGTVENFEVQVRHKSGSLIDLLMFARLIDIAGEQYSLILAQDITEKKRLESQVQQRQKMETLGTLIAGVAHEINNPINTIMNNAPLLRGVWKDLLMLVEERAGKEPGLRYGGLTGGFLKENLDQLISDIDMAANRVAVIVKGLKDFSRKTSPLEKQVVDINIAVENAIRLAGSTIRKSGITLALDLTPDLPSINANLQNLEQIILNLVVNAVQAIEHKYGKIKITTSHNKDQGTIVLSVQDNGRGISTAISDKIFDPFFTEWQSIGGTGLGLPITQNLVKANDGEITFKSRMGKGTAFLVSFTIERKKRPFKILLVDDEEAVLEAMKEALTIERHYMVEQARDGNEALIKIGIYHPDLLILDVFMPKMDGVEVCRAIKRQPEFKNMKIIILTGYPGHEKVKEVAEMGFTKVVSKPFQLQEFMNEVDGMLGI